VESRSGLSTEQRSRIQAIDRISRCLDVSQPGGAGADMQSSASLRSEAAVSVFEQTATIRFVRSISTALPAQLTGQVVRVCWSNIWPSCRGWLRAQPTYIRSLTETARCTPAARKARDSASGERPATEMSLLRDSGPVQNLSARRFAMLDQYTRERDPP